MLLTSPFPCHLDAVSSVIEKPFPPPLSSAKGHIGDSSSPDDGMLGNLVSCEINQGSTYSLVEDGAGEVVGEPDGEKCLVYRKFLYC